MATEKKYIGNGKATKFDGIQVSIRLEDAQEYLKRGQSGTWLNFIVSPRKAASENGRTHTAFVLVDASEEAKPAMVAEPSLFHTPEAEYAVVNGKRMKRISPEEAAKRKAAKQAK